MKKIFLISMLLLLFSDAYAEDWTYEGYLEPRERRSGAICYSKAQAESYSWLVGHGVDVDEAIKEINRSAGAPVCMFRHVAFERRGTTDVINVSDGMFEIAEIFAYGSYDANARGWLIYKHPPSLYIAFFAVRKQA